MRKPTKSVKCPECGARVDKIIDMRGTIGERWLHCPKCQHDFDRQPTSAP